MELLFKFPSDSSFFMCRSTNYFSMLGTAKEVISGKGHRGTLMDHRDFLSLTLGAGFVGVNIGKV